MAIHRKTKIVCTLGPATHERTIIQKLARAGMDVARLNFSHGSYEEHEDRIVSIRSTSQEFERPLAILQDLPGPKIRTGRLKEERVWLEDSEEIVLTTDDIVGDASRISVTLETLPQDVSPGDSIFVNDGMIRLEVIDTTANEIRCNIATGGLLTPMKGINVPGVRLSTDAVTEADLRHLEFGLRQGVEYVGLSFITDAADVNKAKSFIRDHGADTPVIAKIERRQALENIDEIIDAADGIMVARGDLGVEVPLRRVPLEQKRIISKCNKAGKPVIVATQMMESMVYAPGPTRAEASDVANAIFDGADAVMLSAETAIGSYPVQVVGMMAAIAIEAASALPYQAMLRDKGETVIPQPDEAISYSAVSIAQRLDAAVILAFTTSGSTARRVAKFRPECPVLALTSREEVLRRLSLFWGLRPHLVGEYSFVEEIFAEGTRIARSLGMARRGDLIVMTAGVPFGVPGNTNMLKIQRVE